MERKKKLFHIYFSCQIIFFGNQQHKCCRKSLGQHETDLFYHSNFNLIIWYVSESIYLTRTCRPVDVCKKSLRLRKPLTIHFLQLGPGLFKPLVTDWQAVCGNLLTSGWRGTPYGHQPKIKVIQSFFFFGIMCTNQ